MIGKLLCKLGLHHWFMLIIGLNAFFICPRCGKINTVSNAREFVIPNTGNLSSKMDN